MTFVYAILSLACLASSVTGRFGLRAEFRWKYVDWIHPNVALTQKPFIFGNSFTQDVDIDRSGRIFVTSPQWLDGVPITLSLVTEEQGPGGPLLTPYPNYSWHTPNDCEKLISVYRIAIDDCNRLWLVDVGRRGSTVLCPTKIMIFDLTTDRLIHKHVLTSEQTLNGEASYVTPIVELGYSCSDAYLYVADVSTYGLLIYDYQRDYSWRVNNTVRNAFGPNSDAMKITIAGESFDLTDGTLGMCLSPPGFFKDRYLYFNSLASFYQKFTNVNSLKFSEYKEPVVYQSIQKFPSHAGVQAMSRRGVIFFQLVQLTAISCWNIGKPFIPANIAIIAQDEVALQYVSGIKIIVNEQGQEELWFNTNRLQKIINKTARPNEVNYRLIRGLVDDLIRNTVCESYEWPRSHPDTTSWTRT